MCRPMREAKCVCYHRHVLKKEKSLQKVLDTEVNGTQVNTCLHTAEWGSLKGELKTMTPQMVSLRDGNQHHFREDQSGQLHHYGQNRVYNWSTGL